WKRYGVPGDKMPDAPVVIFVHFASVWVPFTSESKEAIANYPVIIKEIKLALQDCARRLGLYLSGVRRAERIAQKKQIFERYAIDTAKALGELTGEAEEKIKETILKIVEEKWREIVAEEGEENEKENQKENNSKGKG
ncbi:MAG: hypothetical protein KAU24_01995, partial [Candidatus Aenigmarchaeota archaeon]|nr:hypothetical protein [Candidatus Aenigmarchaeota archaeon]